MPEIALTLSFNPALDAAKLNVMIRALKTALGPLGREIKLIDAAALKREFETVTASVIESASELKTLQQQIDALKSKSKDTNLPATFRANEMVQAIQTVAGTVNGFTNVGVQFQADLARVGKITGQSGDELEQLGERARELGVKFGGGASPQLKVYQAVLSKLGPQVANNQAALAGLVENVNLLSQASDMGADVSVQAMIDAMLQFGLVTGDAAKDAETSRRVINALAASAQVGSAEIPQLSEAVIEAGQSAKNANLTLEMTTAAIQAIAKGGKYGSTAGIGLRNVLGLLQKASGPAADELKRMGTSSEELGRLLTEEGLPAALARLRDGLNTYGSDAERNAALISIFGQENSTIASILINELDAIEEFHQGTIQGQEGVGAAVEQAAQQMDTAQGKIDRFVAWIQDKGISAFNLLGSNVSAALSVVSQIAPQLAGLAAIKSLIPPGAIAGVGAFAKSLLVTLLPSLFAVNTTTGALTFSFSAMWTAITGPVGIIVAAIVAIGVALWAVYENVEPVRTAIDDLIAFVTPAFEAIWEVIKAVGDILWEVGKVLFEWFITPWKIAYELVSAFVGMVWEWVSGLFASAKGSSAAGAAMGIFSKAIKYTMFAMNSAKGVVRGTLFAIKEFKEIVLDVFRALAKMSFKDILSGIFTGDFGALGKVFSEAGDRLGKAFGEGYKDATVVVTEETAAVVEDKKPPKKTPTGGGLGGEDKKKLEKIRAEIEKLSAESADRIAKIEAAARERAAEMELSDIEEQQKKIAENYLLSAEQRAARWIELELARHQKALAMERAALEEDRRVAVRAVDERIAEVQAKEEYSAEQKARLVAEFQAERQRVDADYDARRVEVESKLLAESNKRKEEFDTKENERALDALRTRLDKEQALRIKAMERANAIQKRINDTLAGVASRAFDARATAEIDALEKQKDRELELVGDSESAKEEVERFYADRRARVEEELAARQAATQALARGQNLYVDRQAEIAQLESDKSRIEAALALTPPESQAAAELRAELDDVAAALAEKGDLITSLTASIEEDFAAGMAGLFAGDNEAMKDGMRQTLGTIAGYLQHLATMAVIDLVLSSPTIKGIAASLGFAGPLFITAAMATIRGAINALLQPVLSSVLSFATGGRVDSPTLAIVGDAGRLTGSNTEWILRDPDIVDIVTAAQKPFTEALIQEVRAMRNEITKLQEPITVARGTDLVRVYDRTRGASQRRRRT